jgi:hypothetical protein
VRALTRRACVRACTQRACVRAHGVRSQGVCACVHTACVRACVRACTRRAYVRAHCVRHTACVRAHGAHFACAHTAACSCAHGVGACIHPAPSPWCTAAQVAASAQPPHGVRACTRRACVRACVRAHGVRARRAFVHPSSAVAIVRRSLLQRHHRRSLLRCCHCVQLRWGLHRGPSRAPV